MREKGWLAKRLCQMCQPAQEDAPQILRDISSDRDSENPILEKLRDVDARMLAEFTKKEHPQTIALIMAHLLPEQAAEILECYSPTLQCEIIKRMATLKEVPLEFIEDIANTLEKEIPANASGNRKLGGARFIGEILKKMGPSSESTIISALDKMEPEIIKKLEEAGKIVIRREGREIHGEHIESGRD